MIHYWWLFVLGVLVGIILDEFTVRKAAKYALKRAEQVEEENDRLRRRIDMIGERTQDGGIQL